MLPITIYGFTPALCLDCVVTPAVEGLISLIDICNKTCHRKRREEKRDNPVVSKFLFIDRKAVCPVRLPLCNRICPETCPDHSSPILLSRVPRLDSCLVRNWRNGLNTISCLNLPCLSWLHSLSLQLKTLAGLLGGSSLCSIRLDTVQEFFSRS